MPETDAILAAHPIEVYLACDSVFQDQPWLSYEPETVLLSLKHEVSDAAVDKLLAVQSVASNPAAVLRSAAAFEKVVTAFNNGICVMDVIQPPEVEEMSYAVSQIAKVVRQVHGEGTSLTFIDETPGYTASVAKFRGWFFLPKNLSYAQDMLDVLTGLQKGTKLYREYSHIVETVHAVVKDTTRADARALLSDSAIVELEKDDTAAMLVKRLIGALLYDPTLPHRHGAAQGTDNAQPS